MNVLAGLPIYKRVSYYLTPFISSLPAPPTSIYPKVMTLPLIGPFSER